MRHERFPVVVLLTFVLSMHAATSPAAKPIRDFPGGAHPFVTPFRSPAVTPIAIVAAQDPPANPRLIPQKLRYPWHARPSARSADRCRPSSLPRSQAVSAIRVPVPTEVNPQSTVDTQAEPDTHAAEPTSSVQLPPETQPPPPPARRPALPEPRRASPGSDDSPHVGAGVTKWDTFADRAYYDPIMAEPRAARIQLIPLARSDEFEYQQKGGPRRTWEITLGRELPIVAWNSSPAPLTPEGLLRSGEWGWGLWVPVSFHMIEDFKDDSNPIINTDMRFGTMVKMQWGLPGDQALSLRIVPWAHESTHLGDEFSISARSRLPDKFERVNVSYEYFEYGISYDNPRVTFRHGGLHPSWSKGYYSSHPSETIGGREIYGSTRGYEPSFGFEYRSPGLGPARRWFASADVRRKIIYDYHKVSADEKEDRQWSWSLMIGREKPSGSGSRAAAFLLKAYYVYFYYGVNPHGQFRSQRDYATVGIGFTFDR